MASARAELLPGLAVSGSSAEISPCGGYRYRLERRWDGNEGGQYGLWIMLNPSTADAVTNDATIKRCIALSRRWGWPALVVVNLFAWRATEPKELRKVPDPIGPQNDVFICDAARGARSIVVAWGANGSFRNRDLDVVQMLKERGHTLLCIAGYKPGVARHPLYERADSQTDEFAFVDSYKERPEMP